MNRKTYWNFSEFSKLTLIQITALQSKVLCNLGDTVSCHLDYFYPLSSFSPRLFSWICLQCKRRGSVSGSGRSSREGNGNPLQNSCLENPRTEEPGGPQSSGSQRVGHDWVTNSFTLSNSAYSSSMFWIYCTSWTSPLTRRLSLGSQTHSFHPVPEHTSHSFNVHLLCWETHTVVNPLNFSYHSEVFASFSSLKHYT